MYVDEALRDWAEQMGKLVFGGLKLVGSGNRRQQRLEIGPLIEPIAIDWMTIGRQLASTLPIAQGVHRYAKKRSGGFDLQVVLDVQSFPYLRTASPIAKPYQKHTICVND